MRGLLPRAAAIGASAAVIIALSLIAAATPGTVATHDATLAAKMPDVVLRAALLDLRGTFAGSAVEVISHGRDADGRELFRRVVFDERQQLDRGERARVSGTREIVIDPALRAGARHELSALLVHEALHQDRDVAAPEERVAHTIQALVSSKLSGARVGARATAASVGTGHQTPGNALLRDMLRRLGAPATADCSGDVFADVVIACLPSEAP